MKTVEIHASNLGKYATWSGYITCHDSPKYAKLSAEDLEEIAASHRLSAVRNAATVELASRRVERWQHANA